MICIKCKSTSVGRKKRRIIDKVFFLNKKKYKCFTCKATFYSW